MLLRIAVHWDHETILVCLSFLSRRCFSRKLGFDLRMIIQDLKTMLKTGNTKEIDQVALHIHLALESYASVRFTRRVELLDRLWQMFGCSHRSRETSQWWLNRLSLSLSFPGNHLTLLYTLVKCLYTINCVAQFYLLSVLLSFPFYSFGTKWLSLAVQKIITRVTYDSQWFPRTVMCDFMVRQLGSNQHWMWVTHFESWIWHQFLSVHLGQFNAIFRSIYSTSWYSWFFGDGWSFSRVWPVSHCCFTLLRSWRSSIGGSFECICKWTPLV